MKPRRRREGAAQLAASPGYVFEPAARLAMLAQGSYNI